MFPQHLCSGSPFLLSLSVLSSSLDMNFPDRSVSPEALCCWYFQYCSLPPSISFLNTYCESIHRNLILGTLRSSSIRNRVTLYQFQFAAYILSMFISPAQIIAVLALRYTISAMTALRHISSVTKNVYFVTPPGPQRHDENCLKPVET